jgi:anti-anti-sigma factor
MDAKTDFCWIRSDATHDGVTIHVQGEIDLATAPLLATALADADGHRVQVDLSEMTFCDAAGLRELALAHQRLGTRLHVTGAGPLLRRLAAVLDMEWLAEDMEWLADHETDNPPVP